MPENNGNGKKSKRYIEYVIGALVVILIVLAVFLVLNYRSLRRSAVINARELRLSAFLAHHGPATVADLAFVRSWMTFDYLNKLFNLPPQYLQTQLSITDPQYPRLTISEYAEHSRLNLAALINELDTALRARLTGTSTIPVATSSYL